MQRNSVVIGTGFPGAALLPAGTSIYLIGRNTDKKPTGVSVNPVFGRYNGCTVSLAF